MKNTSLIGQDLNAYYITNCNLATPKGELANSADLDQMPQNAMSDQGLHCFQMD